MPYGTLGSKGLIIRKRLSFICHNFNICILSMRIRIYSSITNIHLINDKFSALFRSYSALKYLNDNEIGWASRPFSGKSLHLSNEDAILVNDAINLGTNRTMKWVTSPLSSCVMGYNVILISCIISAFKNQN